MMVFARFLLSLSIRNALAWCRQPERQFSRSILSPADPVRLTFTEFRSAGFDRFAAEVVGFRA